MPDQVIGSILAGHMYPNKRDKRHRYQSVCASVAISLLFFVVFFSSAHDMAQRENPLQLFVNAYESIAKCVQTQLSQLVLFSKQIDKHQSNLILVTKITEATKISSLSPPIVLSSSKFTTTNASLLSLQAIDQSTALDNSNSTTFEEKITAPLTKEMVGRATWTFLHAVAGQFPEQPTRQQKRDAKEMMAIISRLYPCKECCDHFKEILKANPVQAGSQFEFSQWMCHFHNVVNRSLGKKIFPCQRVDARWGKLDCPDRACDVDGSSD